MTPAQFYADLPDAAAPFLGWLFILDGWINDYRAHEDTVSSTESTVKIRNSEKGLNAQNVSQKCLKCHKSKPDVHSW
jgi:hypothetical protein